MTVKKRPCVDSLDSGDDFERMTVFGCPLSHIFTSSIMDDFNIVQDTFRFTVIVHEFCADVKLR